MAEHDAQPLLKKSSYVISESKRMIFSVSRLQKSLLGMQAAGQMKELVCAESFGGGVLLGIMLADMMPGLSDTFDCSMHIHVNGPQHISAQDYHSRPSTTSYRSRGSLARAINLIFLRRGESLAFFFQLFSGRN